MNKVNKPIKPQNNTESEQYFAPKQTKRRSLKFTPNKKPKYSLYNLLEEEE